MLTQVFNRRDTETPGECRMQNAKCIISVRAHSAFRFPFLIFCWFALCLCVSAVNSSCGSKPADLRSLIPADSLIYLESNDLGAVMSAITERPAFREAAKTIPDFSALNGVKLAVGVTGFETKEQPVTDENSVLSFQPRFVAILETNAWNFQALAFTEHKLGEFINNVYGGEVELNISDKNDGKYFVWTAQDGRKAYALVQGSLVFFGNDESAIEKSLAVKRGEAESIAKNPKITNGERLAFGYVSPDGVAQIANIIGVKYASDASDEPEVQSAVAAVLPQLMRSSVTEVIWSETKSQDGVEDNFQITMPSDLAKVFDETMVRGGRLDASLVDFVPSEALSVTVYNFKSAQVAWRSLILTTQKSLGPLAAKVFAEIANSAFEPYGVEDAETFLSNSGSSILSMKFGGDDELPLAVTSYRDESNVHRSFPTGKLTPAIGRSPNGDKIYAAADRSFGFGILTNGKLVFGDPKKIYGSIHSSEQSDTAKNRESLGFLIASNAPVATIGRESETATQIANVVSERNSAAPTTKYQSETRFTKTGVERKTTSDFGFIGWIITQFADKDE